MGLGLGLRGCVCVGGGWVSLKWKVWFGVVAVGSVREGFN